MIPQSPTPAGYRFRDVQLEMSLKPFWDASGTTRDAVCRELFEQWRPLCRNAATISVLLWIGDGSEILEYEGSLDREFEWGRYHGSANAILADPAKDTGDPGHTAINGHVMGRDPEHRGVHLRPYLYRPEPARFTFRWLRELVIAIRRIGAEVTSKPILVGETFDIGPEFAVSRFKYDWHREICGGGQLFGGKFIRCDRPLHGDARPYAGFPNGIPAQTSVGMFLGRQARHFFNDLGFDFLWLSNGFGFALEPWALTGAVFDGATFDASSSGQISRNILRFWQDMRAELPEVPIRTRGTNLATGIDLASDASPIREILRDIPGVEAPVNSPWAALDGDLGLELAGWMSHIARLPGTGYRFRFYIHDPWWLNSPWLDRYQRLPFDIYLPLSVSRLHSDGTVEPPCDLAFLTVDDSHGCLPQNVPIEVTSHLLHAREFLPDAPGPIVWVYPFDAYHDLVNGSVKDPARPFFGDWFMRGLITHTVPVNTVLDASDLPALLAGNPSAIAQSILLAPVLPDTCGLNQHLSAFVAAGGKAVLYGPLDGAESIQQLLGVGLSEDAEGDFSVETEGETGHSILRHHALLSAGTWRETGGDTVLARGFQDETSRTACAWMKHPGGGQLGWIRGSLSTSEYDPVQRNKVLGPRLQELPEDQFHPSETLVRLVLARMGLDIAVCKEPGDRDPILTIHRHENAFIFSGYQPSTTSTLALRTSRGAPVFEGAEVTVENSRALLTGQMAWHHSCRIFVEQRARSRIECRIIPAIQHGYTRRLLVTGLQDATVHFFPEPGSEARLEILPDPLFPYFVGTFLTPDWTPENSAKLSGITGDILFSW